MGRIYLTFVIALLMPVARGQVSMEERLKQHVYALADDSLMGREAGSEYARKAADYIVAQWKEIGLKPLVGDSYFRPFQNNRYQNLAAVVEGNDPLFKDEYIVVGAHYDHLGKGVDNKGKSVIYNGADDNASGVATLIELGRLLQERQFDLKRSVVLIAFDAEELGLYGSNEFASNPPFPTENIKLMLSIDMVGWYKKSGYVKFEGLATFKNGKQYLLDEKLIPAGLNIKTHNFERSLFTGTDTKGFAENKIPTMAVTTGLKSPYHKPEDMAHLIDYEGMASIAEYLANLIQAISQDNTFEASGKIAPKHKAAERLFVLGAAVNIGSNYHHYTAGALNGKSASAFGVGLNGQFNLKFLGIRPEVYYDYIAARYPLGKITTHAITVPLNLLLQAQAQSIGGMAVFAGPYYSYKFKGQQGSASLDFDHIFNREEAGLNWGLELRVFNLRMGFTHRNALTNFTREKNADDAHIRNKTSFFSLGYVF